MSTITNCTSEPTDLPLVSMLSRHKLDLSSCILPQASLYTLLAIRVTFLSCFILRRCLSIHHRRRRLVIWKDQAVSKNYVLPPPRRKDNDLCNIFGRPVYFVSLFRPQSI
jgi:hypothetical protein